MQPIAKQMLHENSTRDRSRPVRLTRFARLAALFLIAACSGGGHAGEATVTVVGEWVGTWESSTPGPSGSATLSLTQAGADVAGTIVLAGHPCFGAGSVACTMHGNQMSGWFESGATSLMFHGSCSGNDDDVLSGTYTFGSMGPCGGEQGTIHLSRITAAEDGDCARLPIGELILIGPEAGDFARLSVWRAATDGQ